MSDRRSRVRAAFADLRRRKVFRVAGAYLVIGWVVIEVSSTIFPLVGLPGWAPRLVVILALLGLPVAVVLAWAYDITPEGIRRTESSISAEQWARVQRVLEAALALPESERPAYVRRLAGTDEALLADVLSLLNAHGRAGPLDRPASQLVEPLLAVSMPQPPAEGRVLGQYEILAKLGGGGMGVVYRARDRRLERVVALKFLPPHLSHDPEAKQRFMNEAQAAAALDHPNICTLLEIGETPDGQLFLAMPYYEGETLERRLSRGRLPLGEALDVVIQAASGLAAAHARGIVHRDIKPANLIVTREGVLKVLDFGIAKLAHSSLTSPGITPGTVAYMSPEQARGEPVDARTDVWSLGVVLYEALAGRRPFTGTSDRLILEAIRRGDPDPLATWRPDVPAPLEGVLRRALAPDPVQRWESAAALLEALEHARRGERAATAPADGAGARPEPDAALTPEGERRQATIVVATVGGYARLVEALPPEQVLGVGARIRAATDDVASRFGGHVNVCEDERIELLFGIPHSHEDHCFRGVRAALELHERVRGIDVGRDSRWALRLRTGIDTGQVVAQSGSNGGRLRVIGGSADSAARLQAHAADDELWITQACQRMVGPFFDTVPGEAVTLGAGVASTPHRVLRLSGLRTRIEAAQRTGLTRYVGRQAELGRLQEALEGACQGAGQVVTVLGEAGVGKSRLLHEFRTGPAAGRVTMLEGRCQAFGGAVAYLPFIEVLRLALGFDGVEAGGRAAAAIHAIRSLGDELQEFIPLYLHLLSLAHPEHPLPSHLQGEALRHAMKEAVAGFLTVLTGKQPVLLLLEDWHWADDASRAVLAQIADVAADYALMVVVTGRPGAGEWADARRHTVLSLEPLPAAASAEMLGTVLGATVLPPHLAERVHARTGGNPFFIEEVGRTLIEEGALRVHDGTATLVGSLDALQLPDTVEAVIRSRLDRLDRDTREVVRVASVIGREFERRILEQAIGGSRLPHAIQTLKSAGLVQQVRVVPDAAYRFNHVLTQEVAYASLLERQRVELHRSIAEVIETLYADRLPEHYDSLAEHFSRANAWERAVHYGLAAAERMAGLSAFPEALQQLERCEDWVARIGAADSAPALLVEVLLRQERLCETLGQRARQQQIIDRLVALLEGTDDRRNLAEVYLRQGDLFTLLRRFDEAERALGRSLRLRRELAEPEAIRNSLRSLGLLRWHEGRDRDAVEVIEETLAIDRRQRDADALVGDLSNLGAVLKGIGELDRARATLEEALREIQCHAQPESPARAMVLQECYVLHNLANVHRELGEPDVAMDYLERAKQLIERERLPVQQSYHFTSLAHLYLRQNRVEESLEFYNRAVEMGRLARFTPGLSQALRMLGEVLLGLGRDAEALPNLLEAAGLFAQLEDTTAEAGLWREIARVQERLGTAGDALLSWQRAADRSKRVDDLDAEVEALEGVARTSRRAGLPAEETRAAHLAALARAESAGDRAAQARLLNGLGILAWEQRSYGDALSRYEAALGLFRELADPAGSGLMLNSIGVTLKAMGRTDEAATRLEEALPVHAESGNRLLEGHARAALGELALESGNHERALELFTQSLELRRQIGDRAGEGWMHSRIAAAQIARGSPELATSHAAAARRIAQECADGDLARACEELTLATA